MRAIVPLGIDTLIANILVSADLLSTFRRRLNRFLNLNNPIRTLSSDITVTGYSISGLFSGCAT